MRFCKLSSNIKEESSCIHQQKTRLVIKSRLHQQDHSFEDEKPANDDDSFIHCQSLRTLAQKLGQNNKACNKVEDECDLRFLLGAK